MFKKALVGGTSAGIKVDKAEWEAALDEYYRQNDWDENGVPSRTKLTALALDWVADKLAIDHMPVIPFVDGSGQVNSCDAT